MSWWDKQNLLFGDKWESRIKSEIASSDYFIIILSKNALENKGYIHKELKIALEEKDLFPADKRFIIPILLDDCGIPEVLKDLHCLQVTSEPDWYSKLKESLLCR